jgi:hypothetical protein
MQGGMVGTVVVDGGGVVAEQLGHPASAINMHLNDVGL